MRKWLKDLRVNKGISQQEMAVKLEIAQSYYSMVENGERQKDLDLSIVTRLAEIFNVTVDWIAEQEHTGGEEAWRRKSVV